MCIAGDELWPRPKQRLEMSQRLFEGSERLQVFHVAKMLTQIGVILMSKTES